MEGIVKQTKIGYVVYGHNHPMGMLGYHGKGDKGYPQDVLTACTPFCSPKQANRNIPKHIISCITP